MFYKFLLNQEVFLINSKKTKPIISNWIKKEHFNNIVWVKK